MNKLNTTTVQYNTWLDTEDKLVSKGCYDEHALMLLESIHNDIVDLVDYNFALLDGNDIDSDSTIGAKATRTIEYVAACIDKEEDYASMGRILEARFYDACTKLHGHTNVVRASVQDDVLAGTDFFIYGFRVDITLRDKSEYIVAKDIYYCENNGLRCTASIVNSNVHNTLPAPVLSLRFSGNTQAYQPLYHLVMQHLTPMLLEYNRMCHVLKYIY